MLQWFKKQEENAQIGKNDNEMQISLARKLVDYLAGQISTPKKAAAILSQISRYKDLPPSYQERELPGLYLKVEHYLVNEDPLPKYTKPQLRKNIRYRFGPLMDYEHFSLIFEPEQDQEVLLSLYFLKNVLIHANPVIGNVDEELLNNLSEWVYMVPNTNGQAIPFDINERIPENIREWPRLLSKVSVQLFHYLEEIGGESQAASIYENSYRDLAEIYRSLETFYSVVQMLPDKLLDETKIGLLNAEQVRNVFLNKVQHLQRANDELLRKNRELKNAQEELIIAQDTAMESVKLLHSVLDAVEEGIVTADAEGKIILVNEQIKKIYGYDEQEIIGQSIEFLMPEKYRTQHRQGMKRYKDTKESRAIGQWLTLEGLRKDRSVFPCEVQVTETQIAGRVFFTAAIRDISEDLKQESTLERTTSHLRGADQRFRNLLDASPDPIFTLSLDGTFTRLNAAFEKLTGWEKDDWINKPFTQLVHPDDSIATLKLFQEVLQGESASLPTVRVRTLKGPYLIAELVITPDIQNGKMAGAMGILKNLTPYVEKERALKAKFNRVRLLLDNTPDAAVLVVNRKIAYVNKAGLNVFGARDVKQVLDKNFESFIISAKRSALQEAAAALTDRQELHTEVLRLDGQSHPLKIMLQPIALKQGNGFMAYLRRDNGAGSEAAIRPELSHFSPLLDVFSEAVLFVDENGVIRLSNRAARELLNNGADFAPDGQVQAFLAVTHHQELNRRLTDPDAQESAWETGQAQTADGALLDCDLSFQRLNAYFPQGLFVFLRPRIEQVDPEELQILRAELQAARAKFRDAQSLLQQLQTQSQSSENELKEARQRADNAESMISKLTTELRTAQNRLTDLEAEQAAAGEELTRFREKLELLGRMVPVCAQTLQIRDDREYWDELRQFIRDPRNQVLLKGLSPEARKTAPPDAPAGPPLPDLE